MNIIIINYGAGNIQSLKFAFRRLGHEAVLSHDRAEIEKADKVIFPGVGEASSAMQKLKETGLDTLIPNLEQPVLGICLGMQLMCNGSEEGSTEGMGIFDVDVLRFPKELKVPQMGWNTIDALNSPLFEDINDKEHVYMVHSYFAGLCDDTISMTDYYGPYSSALGRDNFYGTQFHPEKSGMVGEQILRNFLKLEIRN
ncbi:MAG: imidazole glycerol phosphate synthase subunit HisH [Bacteroidota bacterium]